jgi:hypothetical protein
MGVRKKQAASGLATALEDDGMMGHRDTIHLPISAGGRIRRPVIGVSKMSLSEASTSDSYL